MPKVTSTDRTSAERQLAGRIATCKPDAQRLIRAVRNALRKRFPTANELAYDYARSFVLSYSPTDRGLDAIVALVADADGVRLHLNHGPSLPDPHKILRGDRGLTRHIPLDSAAVLRRPEVDALISAAARTATTPLPKSGRGEIIIKTSSSKQRPRTRPAKR